MLFSDGDREGFLSFCPEARNDDVVVQNAGDELLVYNLKTNQAICLNKSAALVWQSCDGKTEVRSIAERLENHLKSPIDLDFVLFALKQLRDADLIKMDDSIPNEFGIVSRRDVVKKIGYGALVAIPIVSSIVAPPATFAQSVCFNAAGNAPGTPISPNTSCAGPLAACLNVCNNQTNAPTACQSCSAAFQGQPTACTISNPCVCVCA